MFEIRFMFLTFLNRKDAKGGLTVGVIFLRVIFVYCSDSVWENKEGNNVLDGVGRVDEGPAIRRRPPSPQNVKSPGAALGSSAGP